MEHLIHTERADHSKEVDDLKKWRTLHQLLIDRYESALRSLRLQTSCSDDPPTGLSGTMEPERCECEKPIRGASFGEKGWVDWNFCPRCGKPLAGKEKKLPRYGEETEETHYVPVCKRCKVWESLLDKEYTEHTKEVADLKRQNNALAEHYVGGLGQELLRLNRENDDLKQRISELEGQLQDDQPIGVVGAMAMSILDSLPRKKES